MQFRILSIKELLQILDKKRELCYTILWTDSRL